MKFGHGVISIVSLFIAICLACEQSERGIKERHHLEGKESVLSEELDSLEKMFSDIIKSSSVRVEKKDSLILDIELKNNYYHPFWQIAIGDQYVPIMNEHFQEIGDDIGPAKILFKYQNSKLTNKLVFSKGGIELRNQLLVNHLMYREIEIYILKQMQPGDLTQLDYDLEVIYEEYGNSTFDLTFHELIQKLTVLRQREYMSVLGYLIDFYDYNNDSSEHLTNIYNYIESSGMKPIVPGFRPGTVTIDLDFD